MKMSYKSKYKLKKAFRTTLGVAPGKSNGAKSVDLSHVRKPIETSLFGLKQVLGLLETGTEEIRDYITYECDLIYECRICRTIFRSLANFILHKREYCRDKFTVIKKYNCDSYEPDCKSSTSSHDENTSSRAVSPCNNVVIRPLTRNAKKNLDSVLIKLEARQKSCKITELVKKEDISNENCAKSKDEEIKLGDVALQEINGTLSAAFQTVITDVNRQKDDNELMKSEVMEIHSMLNNDEVILDSDGKVMNRKPKPKDKLNVPDFNLSCKVCHQKFSTIKTLTHHIKYKHNNTKVLYLCPENGCKDNVYANTWSVFRHLYKVHRKSPLQVKRMRSLIQASTIKRSQITPNKEVAKESSVATEENTEWIQNLEGDNDIQMCGGCGKRYERKAALHSHSQLCMKRIAASKTAPTSDAADPKTDKKSDPTDKTPETAVKSKKVGSQKRKPANILKKQFRKVNNGEWNVVNPETPPKISEPNIFEPETMLVETNDVIVVEERRSVSRNSDVICVSDEDEHQTTNLVSKAESYMSINVLKCLPCDHSFKTHEDLMKHMSAHFKWFHFQCSVCFFKSYDQKTVTNHVKKLHPVYKNKNDIVVPLLHKETLRYATDFQNFCALRDVDSEAESGIENADSKSSGENTPKCTILENNADAKDPSIQKMIMEVIFGNVNAPEAMSRPIRNRVIPKNDDFVYEGEMRHLLTQVPNGKTLRVYKRKRADSK